MPTIRDDIRLMFKLVDAGGAVYNASAFDLVADANYQSGGKWYKDAAFMEEATDNWPLLRDLVTLAAGQTILFPPGNYYFRNGGANWQSPGVFDGVDVNLLGVGDVTFFSEMVELPLVGGGFSSYISRNAISIANASRVVIRNITFHGSDNFVLVRHDQDDVDYRYRQSPLEIRDCGEVEFYDVWTTGALGIYSPNGHGGVLGSEDPSEGTNIGTLFVSDCSVFRSKGGGIKGETRVEGWEINRCATVDVKGFYSEAALIWTPLNIRSDPAVGSSIDVDATIKNSPGSAIGVGGQDATIRVKAHLIKSGGVNLNRWLGSTVESRGWKSAYVEVTGRDLQNSSHGFGCKTNANLPRVWNAVDSKFDYYYGNLVVRGNLEGCSFGVWADHVRDVDIDMVIKDAVDTSGVPHPGSHSGLSGRGFSVYSCGKAKVRGKVTGDSLVSVTGTGGTADCAPTRAWQAYECENLDADVDIFGGEFTNDSIMVWQSIDGLAVGGDRLFKSCNIAGLLKDGTVQIGLDATKKLNTVQFNGLMIYDSVNGPRPAAISDLVIFAYRTYPVGVITLAVTGGAQSIPNAAHTRVDFTTKVNGNDADVDLVGNQIRPRMRGMYLVTGRARLLNVPADCPVYIELWRNEAAYQHTAVVFKTGSGVALSTTLMVTGIFPLGPDIGERIELRVRQESGGAITMDVAYMQATLLHGL